MSEDRPVQPTPDVIAGHFKPLTLRHLRQGTLCLNAMRRLMQGISQQILTAALRELRHEGLVRRQIFLDIPPRANMR